MREASIPSDWQYSVLLPIHKSKGDPMNCVSYRRIILKIFIL